MEIVTGFTSDCIWINSV